MRSGAMTASGSIGLVAIFIVDFLSLLYVSRLGDHVLTASVGFASQVMFFAMSVNIAMAIAISATVSRALGAGKQFPPMLIHMIASGEDYRDPDYVNNPQFDPGNPQTSLARMTEFYGPLQPVPPQYLRTTGAYLGDGPRTSYDQQRTIRTGRSALGANPGS